MSIIGSALIGVAIGVVGTFSAIRVACDSHAQVETDRSKVRIATNSGNHAGPDLHGRYRDAARPAMVTIPRCYIADGFRTIPNGQSQLLSGNDVICSVPDLVNYIGGKTRK